MPAHAAALIGAAVEGRACCEIRRDLVLYRTIPTAARPRAARLCRTAKSVGGPRHSGLEANRRQRSDWHFNCLATVGRWWPGTL